MLFYNVFLCCNRNNIEGYNFKNILQLLNEFFKVIRRRKERINKFKKILKSTSNNSKIITLF